MNRLTGRVSDSVLLAGALILIVLITLIAVGVAPPTPDAPVLSVRSAEADGAMALRRWLEASGYTVREMLADPVDLDGFDVLFILDPLNPYTPDEAETLRRWVSGGGRLIVAGSPLTATSAVAAFGIRIEFVPASLVTLDPAAPLLTQPPQGTVRPGLSYILNSERADFVTHFAREEGPMLLSLREGAGTLWASAMTRPFTNRGLSDPGSAELIANLLAGLPTDAVIGFDEAAHGFNAASESLFFWLFTTPPGWGILSGIALTMFYLLLRGRRFGAPVPLPEDRLRREPVEYIVAMANLTRRSGLRGEVLNHYNERLRRALAARYNIDPALPPDSLARAVAQADPTVSENDLAGLLRRLSAESISEEGLITAAREVDAWLKGMESQGRR